MRSTRTVLFILVSLALVIAAVVFVRPYAFPAPEPTPLLSATHPPPMTPERHTPQPSATLKHEAGYTRPTSTPGPAISQSIPSISPTFDPNLLLTPQFPPTETATPRPLGDLGGAVELTVIQLQRIVAPDGVTLIADVLNPTDRPVKDVNLVFADASGTRVGRPQPLSLSLTASEASPGTTDPIAPNDPIFANWGTLQIHAIGIPNKAGSGQQGYPVALEVGYPEVSADKTSIYFRFTVTNSSESAVAVPHQSLAFFASDGTLLLVWKLGSHSSVSSGEAYDLAGSIPLGQPVAEGRSLQEYSDVLAVIAAEVAP